MTKQQQSHEYYLRNRERLKVQNNSYRTNRRRNDPVFRALNGEKARQWRQDNPEKARAQWARRSLVKSLKNHGMTMVDYLAMLEKQNHACAICQQKGRRRLNFDHDHATGEVRGLLCDQCNFGIGQFKDNIVLLESAIKYLKSHIQTYGFGLGSVGGYGSQ